VAWNGIQINSSIYHRSVLHATEQPMHAALPTLTCSPQPSDCLFQNMDVVLQVVCVASNGKNTRSQLQQHERGILQPANKRAAQQSPTMSGVLHCSSRLF
jgi:hypothetical protein